MLAIKICDPLFKPSVPQPFYSKKIEINMIFVYICSYYLKFDNLMRNSYCDEDQDMFSIYVWVV